MKIKLRKALSMILVTILLVTSISLSTMPSDKTLAATAYYPSLSYNLGNLSIKNTYLARLLPKGKNESTASMCSINLSGVPVFCMLKGGSLSRYNAFYAASIDNFGKSFQKYFRGAVYYYKDINNEFSLSTTARYVVSQIMIWRILQIRSYGKFGTYDNIMNGFENIFKDIIKYWGVVNANTAWNEIKKVMQWCNNGEEKVNEKHVKLYLWTHSDGTQPLMTGTVTKPKEVPPEKKAYITLQKKGEVDNAVVKDAKFGIYSKKDCTAASRICILTTDVNGKATTTDAQAEKLLPSTTYYVKEIQAPSGSKLNTKVFKIKTNESNSSKKAVKLTVTDNQYKIKISVVKVDKKNKSKKLQGAVFRVSQWNTNNKSYVKYKDYTTNVNGKITTEWLYYTKSNQGKFRIKEISAPDGYKNNGFTKDIQISSKNTDKTVEYTAKDSQDLGGIEIHKAAFRGNKNVSNQVDLCATFTVYSNSACTEVAGTIKTDGSTGKGKINGLKPGTYYIKETKWKIGVIPAFTAAQKVTVNAGKTTTIKGSDGKLGRQLPWGVGIRLRKVDADNNSTALSGAMFGIYEWNGVSWELIDKPVSNAQGIVEVSTADNKLYYTKTNQGKFKVVELSAPEGYILEPTPRYVTITKENAEKTVDLGLFENAPKKGNLEIKKVIVNADGSKVTNVPMNSSVLNITYGLYTDSRYTKAVNNTIKLNKDGYAKIENLSAGVYYLKETTANRDIFAGSKILNTRYIEITINRGKTTYVDGEKGYSEDGVTWHDCWSTAITADVNPLMVTDSLTLSTLSTLSTLPLSTSVLDTENPNDSEYTVESNQNVENKKTINDVEYSWKELSDKELDEILGYSKEADLAEFLISLSDEDLDLILSKDTRLTEPYISYEVNEDGKLETISEEIFWEYLMSLPYRPALMSAITNKKGYFYINISGDGKTTLMTINVETNASNTNSSAGIKISTSGTNNHNFKVSDSNISTQLAAGGLDYNIIQMKFSYTKPAHYTATSGRENYAVNSNGTALACHFDNTLNNTGHNTSNVTENVHTYLNIINTGLVELNNKSYHATLKINLNRDWGGLRVNPNGGSWKFGTTTYNSNAYVIGHQCGWVSTIGNPTRTGYTFTGWTLTNGANAHGTLTGNVYGANITTANSSFTFGGKATNESGATASGYYSTLTANWSVNQYDVTCIDVVGSKANGKELGRSTWKANYGTTVSGLTKGSNTVLGAYYKDYYYIGSSYAKVTTSGATVYRYFSKSPAAVIAPNVLKNVLKTIELDIIKTDSTDNTKTLDATFDVLEWSQSKKMYVPYLTGVKAQQRIALRFTLENLGKYKVIETQVQSDYVMSQVSTNISIYDDNVKSIPYYENTMGIKEDLGIFVRGRGYNSGDIVRDRVDKTDATWYRCIVSNVNKNVTNTVYWQKITSSSYDRYEDLINGAGEWNEGLDVYTVMAMQASNIKKPAPGHTSISINKENNKGDMLEGAKFAAYYTDGQKCVEFATQERNTQYISTIIDISDKQTHSTYDETTGIRTLNLVIKEEKAPYGYKKTEDIQVTIKSKLNASTNKWEVVSQTATFDDGSVQDITKGTAITVVDQDIKLNISITKKSTENTYDVATLEGAVYGIYDNADCTSLVEEAVIDSEGKAALKGLTLKDYWIKEISAPTSGLYMLNDEVKYIDASELYDETESISEVNTSVTVTDEPYMGEILVKKYGYTDAALSQTKELEGAGFTLYALPDIPQETDEDKYVMSYDFSNKKAVREEVKTDKEGIARFNDLPLGDYVVVETTVPDGYIKAENKVVHLTKEYTGNNDDTAYPVVMYDMPYTAPIKIYKVSSDDESLFLEGAVFRIFDVNADAYISEITYGTDEEGNEIEENEVKLYTSDENGLITTEPLKEGNYRIEEVSAPAGYLLNKEQMEVSIEQGKETGYDENGYPYYEVKMQNKPTNTYFKKIDISTKEEIKGGYYKVSDSEGNIIDEWNGSEEPHHIYGLLFGEEYTFTEEIAPDGYVVAESIIFTINEDGTPTEVVMEDDYNKIQISKQDITTGEELSGAHLQVIDENGKVVEEWISTDTPHKIDRLSVGTYTLKETQAPDGYIISESITFEVGECAEIQEVVMYDDYTKTAFIKLAEDTQEPLAGCVLQVLDDKGKVVDEWTTGGDIHYTYKLTKGEIYTLHEKSAPDGYQLAPDIKFVAGETYESNAEKELENMEIVDKEGIGIEDDSAIEEEADIPVQMDKEALVDINAAPDDGLEYEPVETEEVTEDTSDEKFNISEVVTVTMTDSPLEIIPEKVDENGNPVYGAVLQLLNEKGEVVYEWETDIMQTQGFKVVPGTYTIHEVSAPAGYQKIKDTKVTVVDKDVSVKLVDHTIKATITKVNENGEVLEGARLQVLDKDGKIVNQWLSKKESHIITNLKDGETYTLHEVSAPNGYVLAEDVTFKMDKTNVEVKMVDEYEKIEIPRTGKTVLDIFVFAILSIGGILLFVWRNGAKKKNFS